MSTTNPLAIWTMGEEGHTTRAFVATLPDGSRVELPAGTVLREDDRITFARTIRPEHMPPVGLEDGAILGTVEPEGAIVPADPDPWLAGLTITTANAIRSGIDRGLPAKAGVAAVIAAFQAGVDMAIDPPRCTGKRPANAGTTGIECDDYACNVHGRGAIRRLHEMAPSVTEPDDTWQSDGIPYCKVCHKTHGAVRGEKMCGGPGSWILDEPRT